MKPIFMSIGPYQIFTFGFLLSISFLIASYLVWKFSRADLMEEEMMDTYVYSSLVALLSARLVYIIFHFEEFGLNILKYFVVREVPGLSLLGGLIGGIIFLWYYTKRKKLKFFKVADIFSIVTSFGLSVVSLGQFLGGATYGKETNLPWGINVYGQVGRRHPVEIYSFLIFLIFFIILLYLYKKRWYGRREGIVSIIFLFGFSLIFFLLEFLKVSSVYLYRYISLNQFISTGIMLLIIAPISYRFIASKLKKG